MVRKGVPKDILPAFYVWWQTHCQGRPQDERDQALLALTDEQVQAFEADYEETNRRNRAMWDAFAEQMLAAKKELLTYLDSNSNEYRYIEQRVLRPYYHDRWNLGYTITQPRKVLREQQRKSEREQVATEHRDAAVKYLLEHGRVYGTDFNVDSAIHLADALAGDLEIQRLKAEITSDQYLEFEGQTCDGPCAGWDGESHRCECGHRRVGWITGYGHSFQNPIVYAEAC